jgi:hypothetical protein
MTSTQQRGKVPNVRVERRSSKGPAAVKGERLLTTPHKQKYKGVKQYEKHNH